MGGDALILISVDYGLEAALGPKSFGPFVYMN